MEVFYKFFDEKTADLYKNAKSNNKKLSHPFKKYESDFCYDVVATSINEIHPGVYEYGIGLGFQINRTDVITQLVNIISYNFPNESTWKSMFNYFYDNLLIDIDLRPRSSIRDTGLILCNCEGTIDEDYTNEVKATFYHVIPSLPIYEIGEKIGQIKLGFSFKIDFKYVSNDFETYSDKCSRGLQGHGASGK